MNTSKITKYLKLNGFVNAGQLVFNNDEIEELSSLCRDTFKRLSEQNGNGELHKDFIDGSGGAEGFSRVPEHDRRLLELLDKLVNDSRIIRILNDVLGPDYKIWQIVYRKAGIGDKGLSLHQDSYGETNLSILLSDNQKGFGSTIFLPGSHLVNKTLKQFKIITPTILLRWILFLFSPLIGKKGDIAFFFNHTWHGRSPNKGQESYDVILFSIFPASGSMGYDGYGEWSNDLLRKKTTLSKLVNPKIGTKSIENGRFEILSSNDSKNETPFVLEIYKENNKFIKNNKIKLYSTIYLLRVISLIIKPFRIFLKL